MFMAGKRPVDKDDFMARLPEYRGDIKGTEGLPVIDLGSGSL
jgi:hypothetical protein